MASINDMLSDIVVHIDGQADCDIDVINFPDQWEDFYLTHPVGDMLVQFGGETDSASVDSAMIVQERHLKFGVTLLFRNLNGHTGAYHYLDKLRSWLTGFAPTDCQALLPKKSQFVAQDNGLWTYMSEFACKSVNVQTMAKNATGNLQHLTHEAHYET